MRITRGTKKTLIRLYFNAF